MFTRPQVIAGGVINRVDPQKKAMTPDGASSPCTLECARSLYLARPAGATRPSCELFNIGTNEHPVTPDLFSRDDARLRKLTHSANRHAKQGGNFLYIH